MGTYDAIINEMKGIPKEQLEDLYKIAQSLNPKSRKRLSNSKKILSFAGAFKDMDAKDYKDFLKQTKDIRKNLFDRTEN